MEKKNTLPLISNKKELLRNVMTLDGYLKKTNNKECGYAKALVKKGKCFVVVSSSDGYSFYPSRFMGYVDNTMEKHEKMGAFKKITGKTTRDGKETTPEISQFLGDLIKKDDTQWNVFEIAYINFCKKIGITPDKKERKFWQPISMGTQ